MPAPPAGTQESEKIRTRKADTSIAEVRQTHPICWRQANVSGFQFHPAARRFDYCNAEQLAAASQLVYEEPSEVEQLVGTTWQMRRVAFVDVAGTQAFVAANDELILVCFRGTEPDHIEDWITDARLDMVDGPLGGRVHAGFYGALSHVWQQIDDLVIDFTDRRPQHLWVTGHSLGGALATLATARWLEEGRDVQGLYTYGQPRAGDRNFVRQFNFAFKPYTYRMVNHNDLVARLPPWTLGYRHSGTLKYFNELGQLRDQTNWWRNVRVGLGNLVGWASDGVNDHGLTEYRRLLTWVARAQSVDLQDQWALFLDRARRHAA